MVSVENITGLNCTATHFARFGRKILGVFNRGDGILWDLIECINQETLLKILLAVLTCRELKRSSEQSCRTQKLTKLR